jgi:hypothetical protein
VPRQPEVEQDRPALGQDHVLGLEVQVDHPLPVQVGQMLDVFIEAPSGPARLARQ